jgi:hypothetical protein
MKFQLLMALTIASPFWLSQPANAQGSFCHAVLSSPKNINPEKIHVSIHELAQLKMTADLAKAAGISKSVVFSAKQFSASYNQKFAEMTRELIGRYSESQIKEMILKDIQEMQGLKAEEIKQEAQVRDAHKKLEMFTKSDEVDMVKMRNTIYLETADVLIGKSDGDLVLVDPNNEYKVVFPQRKNHTFSVTPDGHQLIMISTNGRVQIYDLILRKQVSQSSEGLIKGMDHSSMVSPHGIVVTISSNGRTLNILNLDGTVRNIAPTFSGSGISIDKFRFISDHEVLIHRSAEEALYIMDLNTGITTHIETTQAYQTIELTSEKDKILLMSVDSYAVIAVKDLRSFSQKATFFPREFLVEGFLGNDLVYVSNSNFIDMELQNEYTIVNLKDMATPQFGFVDTRSVNDIESIAADPKHGRTFIFTFDSDSAEYHLEIWKREKVH